MYFNRVNQVDLAQSEVSDKLACLDQKDIKESKDLQEFL